MNQQELLKRALEFLARTDIKGAEAEDMAMVKSWIKQVQGASLTASLGPRTGVQTVPAAGAGEVAGTAGK